MRHYRTYAAKSYQIYRTQGVRALCQAIIKKLGIPMEPTIPPLPILPPDAAPGKDIAPAPMPTVNIKETLLFYHIPKTAGTAFIHYLERALPEPMRISRISNDAELETQMKRLLTLSEKERKQIKIVFGHRAFDVAQYFTPSHRGTFLRHPIERAISHYNFHNKSIYNGMPMRTARGFIGAQQRPPLEEVGEKRFLELLIEMMEEKSGYDGRGAHSGNYQAMSLAYFMGRDPKNISEKDIPELLAHLDFVGIQEHFNLSIFMLHKLYGFPLLAPSVENDGKEFKTAYLPQWFIARCRERFHLDFMLYELALKRFDEQYNRMMDMSENHFFDWVKFQKAKTDRLAA